MNEIKFNLSPNDLKLIDVENLGLQHDLPALTVALIDPLRAWEKEHGVMAPAGVVRILLEAVENMRKVIQVQASLVEVTPAVQSQLSGVANRYAGYKLALDSVKPEDPAPAALHPFLHNVSGVGHYTPDALTPFAIDNQILAIAENRSQNQANVARYVVESAAGLGQAFYDAALAGVRAGKAVVDSVKRNWTPLLIGGGLILALGVGIYAYRKGG